MSSLLGFQRTSAVRKYDDGFAERVEWAPLVWHALLVLLILFIALLLVTGGSKLVGFSLIILTVSMVIGGALGFLFGIPRVMTPTEAAGTAVLEQPAGHSSQSPADSGAKSLARRKLTTNTNLEKVSDWLTTMLVGVGLTQLLNVNSALVGFRDFLATYAVAGSGEEGALGAGVLPVIGPMLLIAGTALGFVYFYVFTRVVIAPKFHGVEVKLDSPVVGDQQAAAAVRTVAETLPLDTVATRNVLSSNTPSVADSLSVMFEALYQPGGYQEALKLGEALKATPAVKNPEYWFYLAAAYGQQHKSASAADKPEVRAKALQAARTAVQLNATYRGRLRSLLNPYNLDNDLSDFRQDPEFLYLFGSLRGASGPPNTFDPSYGDLTSRAETPPQVSESASVPNIVGGESASVLNPADPKPPIIEGSADSAPEPLPETGSGPTSAADPVNADIKSASSAVDPEQSRDAAQPDDPKG